LTYPSGLIYKFDLKMQLPNMGLNFRRDDIMMKRASKWSWGIKKVNVLIAGGAGFIGCHLTDALTGIGCKVVCADNLRLGGREKLEKHSRSADFSFYETDICDERRYRGDFHGPCVRQGISYGCQFGYTKGRKGSFDRFSRHFSDNDQPVERDEASRRRRSRADAWGAVYDFIAKLKKDPVKLEILGDGKQGKPYIYVADLVDAMLSMHYDEGVNVCNVGVEMAASVRRIADIVCEEMGLANVEYSFTGGAAGWPGDVPKFQYDLSRIHSLGRRAEYTSDEAVRLAARLSL
jgi:nucleoside-diphosphate-sugar epimerase